MNNQKEQTFYITPKGIMVVMLVDQFGVSMDDAEQFCNAFVCRMQSDCDHGEIRGVPCLVLKEGWHLIGAKPLPVREE